MLVCILNANDYSLCIINPVPFTCREREKLRLERERIEREKQELIKLERERQKAEREKIEREKEELRRAKMTISDHPRGGPIKRSFEDDKVRRREPEERKKPFVERWLVHYNVKLK